MAKWSAFLASLATRGGAIFILLSIVGVVDFAAFVMYLRHDIGYQGLATFCGSGAFTGALLLALKGSSDNVATITGTGGSASVSSTPTPAPPPPGAPKP
jgi:diaminopimelate epimerase